MSTKSKPKLILAALAMNALALTAMAADDHLVWKSGRYGIPPAASQNGGNGSASNMLQQTKPANGDASQLAPVAAQFKSTDGNNIAEKKSALSSR